MLTFVVDDFSKGFSNLYPLSTPLRINGLVGKWALPSWLKYFSIDYNTVESKNATPESWYPIDIIWWDYNHDYLGSLPGEILESLSAKRFRLLFYYKETDNPQSIRKHINDMCLCYAIDPQQILLISGNSIADQVPGCRAFWHFDCQHYFETLKQPKTPISVDPKPCRITCLSRSHKLWREWFVFNIVRHAKDPEIISYGIHGQPVDDFDLWQKDYSGDGTPDGGCLKISPPDDAWRASLPLRADDLTPDEHNDHSIVIQQHYTQSYWNIVLETMLDADGTDGIFVTEKTLKPIRNGQSFVVLGCHGSLAYLREHGYKTFSPIIDETYDQIKPLHRRWNLVHQLTKQILDTSKSELHLMYQSCLPIIQHNQEHFYRSRRPELLELTTYLDTV